MSCSRCGQSGSKLSFCSRCHAVSYCSAECQKMDWKGGHNQLCDSLKAQRVSSRGKRDPTDTPVETVAPKAKGASDRDAKPVEAFVFPEPSSPLSINVATVLEKTAPALPEHTKKVGQQGLRRFMSLKQAGMRQDLVSEGQQVELLLLKSANEGMVEAQLALGEMYLSGCSGVCDDKRAAHKWLKLASENGDKQAQHKFALLLCSTGFYAEAFPWLASAARHGLEAAQFDLGRLFLQGAAPTASAAGSPPNAREALAWFAKAAEQGHALAQFNVGLLLSQNEAVACLDPSGVHAFSWIKRAALQGNGRALLNLSDMYFNGKGVEQNLEEAHRFGLLAKEEAERTRDTEAIEKANRQLENIELAKSEPRFRKLINGIVSGGSFLADEDQQEACQFEVVYRAMANRGNPDASYRVGLLHMHGLGAGDESKGGGERWFQFAAQQGHQGAQYELGMIALKQGDATKVLALLGKCDDCRAMFNLGCFYLKGTSGFVQDWALARPWFEKAAKAADAQGETEVAASARQNLKCIQDQRVAHLDLVVQRRFMSLKNRCHGSPNALLSVAEQREATEVRDLLLAAAKQGSGEAQLLVGSIFEHGMGIKRDLEEAAKWYLKAADQGNANAQFYFGALIFHQRQSEALKWFTKSAEQGFPHANLALGECSLQRRQFGEARAFFEKSVAQAKKLGAHDVVTKGMAHLANLPSVSNAQRDPLVNRRVELRDLVGRPELNGRVGKVARPADASGRYVVEVEGETVSLKKEKLRCMPHPHALKSSRPQAVMAHTCDLCHAAITDALLNRCQECDYDECRACYEHSLTLEEDLKDPMVGRRVIVVNLKAFAKLNGSSGVVKKFIADLSRYDVALDSGKTIRMQLGNLRIESELSGNRQTEPASLPSTLNPQPLASSSKDAPPQDTEHEEVPPTTTACSEEDAPQDDTECEEFPPSTTVRSECLTETVQANVDIPNTTKTAPPPETFISADDDGCEKQNIDLEDELQEILDSAVTDVIKVAAPPTRPSKVAAEGVQVQTPTTTSTLKNNTLQGDEKEVQPQWQEAQRNFLEAVTLLMELKSRVDQGKASWSALRGKGEAAKLESLLKRAAQAGHAPAQCQLGVLFLDKEGKIIRRSVTEGLRLLKLSAEQNFEPAQMFLAKMDSPDAFKWIAVLADKGDLQAQYEIGHRLYHGIGVRKDLLKSEKYLRKVFETGGIDVRDELGKVCFDIGDACSDGKDDMIKSTAEARLWWIKSAEMGNADAQNALGVFSFNDKNHDAAVGWWSKAALGGNAKAQLRLGTVYQGEGDVPVNLKQSAKYFQAAADQGNKFALYNIGLMLENGMGVEQNCLAAAVSFKKAVKLGYVKALLPLARLYESGKIGQRSSGLKSSLQCYEKAALQGDSEIANLGREGIERVKMRMITPSINTSAPKVQNTAPLSSNSKSAKPKKNKLKKPTENDLGSGNEGPVLQRPAPASLLIKVATASVEEHHETMPLLPPLSVTPPPSESIEEDIFFDPENDDDSEGHGSVQTCGDEELMDADADLFNAAEAEVRAEVLGVCDLVTSTCDEDVVSGSTVSRWELRNEAHSGALEVDVSTCPVVVDMDEPASVSEVEGAAPAYVGDIDDDMLHASAASMIPTDADGICSSDWQSAMSGLLKDWTMPQTLEGALSGSAGGEEEVGVDEDSDIEELDFGQDLADLGVDPSEDPVSLATAATHAFESESGPAIAFAIDEDDAEFAAVIRESRLSEDQRRLEDAAAATLVAAFRADLQRSQPEGRFGGLFDPARDGDCLMHCAVEHDFGGGGLDGLGGLGAGGWSTVGGSGRGGSRGAGKKGGAPLTADALRLRVVARVRERRLAELEAEARGLAASAEAERDPARRSELQARVDYLRGPALVESESRCTTMAMPGVVMGEDELQALADVRGACVQVRTVVCIRESSDFGASLSHVTYFPELRLSPLPKSLEKSPAPGPTCGSGSGSSGSGESVGRGDTLVLLQELRAHRMSHFQMVRLPTLSPPAVEAEKSAGEGEGLAELVD